MLWNRAISHCRDVHAFVKIEVLPAVRLEPDPGASFLGSQWQQFTLRTTRSESITVRVTGRQDPDNSGKLNVSTSGPPPSVSDTCRTTYFRTTFGKRNGQTFSLVGSEAGTAMSKLEQRGASELI